MGKVGRKHVDPNHSYTPIEENHWFCNAVMLHCGVEWQGNSPFGKKQVCMCIFFLPKEDRTVILSTSLLSIFLRLNRCKLGVDVHPLYRTYLCTFTGICWGHRICFQPIPILWGFSPFTFLWGQGKIILTLTLPLFLLPWICSSASSLFCHVVRNQILRSLLSYIARFLIFMSLFFLHQAMHSLYQHRCM